MYESFNFVSILRMHNTSSLEVMVSKDKECVIREALSDRKIMTSAPIKAKQSHYTLCYCSVLLIRELSEGKDTESQDT